MSFPCSIFIGLRPGTTRPRRGGLFVFERALARTSEYRRVWCGGTEHNWMAIGPGIAPRGPACLPNPQRPNRQSDRWAGGPNWYRETDRQSTVAAFGSSTDPSQAASMQVARASYRTAPHRTVNRAGRIGGHPNIDPSQIDDSRDRQARELVGRPHGRDPPQGKGRTDQPVHNIPTSAHHQGMKQTKQQDC